MTTVRTVYLAGPISGKSYDGATEWRQGFDVMLGDLVASMPSNVTVECLSPMRGKAFLAGLENLGHSPEEMAGYQNAMASMEGILSRDSHDVETCDAMLVNVLDADTVSQGTVFELGMAYAWRKPVVMVVPHGEHPHRHGMTMAAVLSRGYIAHSLDEAAALLVHLLVPGA
jgi:nucleoside 2-deoxyribosyltransferase